MARPNAWLVLILLAPALATAAHALDPAEPRATHLDADGTLTAGLPVAGLPGVSQATYHLEIDACYRWLTIQLDYDPAALGVKGPPATVSTPYVFELQLTDATTGEELENGTFAWVTPGAHGLRLDEPAALDAELNLRRGLNVSYHLTVTGRPAIGAGCTWQGDLFVNEVEADPPGPDAGRTWVELYNGGLTPVDLSGWTIEAERGDPSPWTIPTGLTLTPGAHVSIDLGGPGLGQAGEVIGLRAPDGWLVDRTPPLTDLEDDARAWQRLPDGSSEWVFSTGTRDASNG